MLDDFVAGSCSAFREAFQRLTNTRLTNIPYRPGGELLLAELRAGSSAEIALSAGLHGDEPAGPWALVSAMERGLDPRFSYAAWPCLNPSGFDADTRENDGGLDVNRTFSRGGTSAEARAVIQSMHGRQFILSLDLHEDRDADGFYCYVAGRRSEALGHAITRAVERSGFALQDLTGFDFAEPGEMSDRRRCEHGVVVRGSDERGLFDGLCYNLFMLRRHARHIVTMESPQRLPLSERIAMLGVAVNAAIDYAARHFRY